MNGVLLYLPRSLKKLDNKEISPSQGWGKQVLLLWKLAIAMHELTLKWIEAGEIRTQTLWDKQPSKNPGTVRIGRDPTRCDIVLLHPTVSGLHVEIFYDAQKSHFYLRNLRPTNPSQVDGQLLAQGEIILTQGSILYLGQVKLKVIAIDPRFPMTVDLSATEDDSESSNSQPLRRRVPRKPLPTYGLRCSHCQKVSHYKLLDFGCPWCGTSLESARSVLMSIQGK